MNASKSRYIQARRILGRLVLPFFLLFPILTAPAGALEGGTPVFLTFFDVGRGDALLIRQPEQCTVLIDAGPVGSGTRIGDYLRRRGVGRLDRIIISHPHPDHFAGILTLPESITVGDVGDNGADNTGEKHFSSYRNWRLRHSSTVLKQGDHWRCGDILFTVVAAGAASSRPQEINAGSIVMLVEIGPVRLLLPGDIEAGGRRTLAGRPDSTRADIVKIPHHGADMGYLGTWLDVVRPDLSVISTGAGAPGGDPVAVELIRRKSKQIWRTDTQGDLEIMIDRGGWRHVGQ